MANKFVSADNLLYVWQKIKTLLGGKVDKVDGKGLSTNDYTSEEKTKLAGISANAQVNKIEVVQVNGNALTPTNKVVNVDLSNYALKSQVASVYKAKGSITWANLIALTTAEIGDVYNVTDKGGANYACIVAKTAGESSWDKLGETVDLSAYYKKTETDKKYVASVSTTTSSSGDDTSNYDVAIHTLKASDGTSIATIPVATHKEATTSKNGLMSSSDKTKLDGLNKNDYVQLEGSQTIKGHKKFHGGATINNATYENGILINANGSSSEKYTSIWSNNVDEGDEEIIRINNATHILNFKTRPTYNGVNLATTGDMPTELTNTEIDTIFAS